MVEADVRPIRNPRVDIRDVVSIIDGGGRDRDTVCFREDIYVWLLANLVCT